MSRLSLLAALVLLGSGTQLLAQGAGTGDGAPPELMTALGFATIAPEAKGFVQRTRKPRETLEFATPYATDVVRPRPRTAAEVETLRRDLEAASARNRARAAAPSPPAPASSTGKPR